MGLPPLVLIHGMWCPPEVWDNFVVVFEAAGFEIHRPALRMHDQGAHGPEPEGIGGLSLNDYVDDIENLIVSLDQKPVLIGHSLGGLVALMAVSRGLAKAAVLLTPAPAAGIFIFKPSAIRVFIRTLLTPGFTRKGVFPTFGEMSLVLNNVDEAEARDLYRYVVWESGRVIFETTSWMLDRKKVTAIAYAQIDTPLLLIGAGRDNLTPPSAIKAMTRKLAHTATYEEFEDNGHWVLGEAGWEKIAARCVEWIRETAI